MKLLIRGGHVYRDSIFLKSDVSVIDGIVTAINRDIPIVGYDKIVEATNKYVLPGLADVHVHLREPGFSYKETVVTGTAAAAKGGFTTVCAMPNVIPPPDNMETFFEQMKHVKEKGKIRVVPYACITKGGAGKGDIVDFTSMSDYAAAFSDDGNGVQSEHTMRQAMLAAKAAGAIIAAHCEDKALSGKGYIHAGEYADAHGHEGIPSESEWRQIERDLQLVRETGCDYHVCHVSTKESVELIRRAKDGGLPVTCETAPHYLVFCDADLEDDGRFKMSPPIRSRDDRKALVEALKDGTIDMIATDHAPHSMEEKSRGLSGSLNGVVGLETALKIMYTEFVMRGIINIHRLIELMCINPRARFKLGGGRFCPVQERTLSYLTRQLPQLSIPVNF